LAFPIFLVTRVACYPFHWTDLTCNASTQLTSTLRHTRLRPYERGAYSSALQQGNSQLPLGRHRLRPIVRQLLQRRRKSRLRPTTAQQFTTRQQKPTSTTRGEEPTRNACILPSPQAELDVHGLTGISTFFVAITAHHVPQIIASLSAVADRDLAPLHTKLNVNFRLIEYTPMTGTSPDSQNGCGAHTDYGTFSIIFQDGTAGLEMDAPDAPDIWVPVPVPVPGNTTVLLCGLLCGWCAVVLSGGKVLAVRHLVRRLPGVRRPSPDLDVKMAPAARVWVFSEAVTEGHFHVRWFEEVMGKK
jgi:hypothetical protein